MDRTERAGWTLVQVRAQHHWDDPVTNKLGWRTSPEVYSEYREAVSRAHEGDAFFGRPSRRRVAHPTVQDATMVIEPPNLWIVLPIPAGVEHRPYCERVYRAAPTDWMERILLPTPGDSTALAKPQDIVSEGEGPTCIMCGHWYDPEFTTGLYCRMVSPDGRPNPGCPPQQEDARRY